MSISNRFFEILRDRADPLEIMYYRERCLFNAHLANPDGPLPTQDQTEQFLDQAHRLDDLLGPRD